MMDRRHRVRVASPNVHSKVFDDEVLVLDMASGMYFSLRGAAMDIWALVQARATGAEIAGALTERYEGPPAAIADATERCLAELAEAGLVAPDPEAGGARAPVPGPAGQEGAKRPFPPPEVERFTDMRELLLLDPIHEVDDRGWPNVPRPA
jgi:Coenzyme PQQ synthesis protein D (PqqD)